MLKCDTIISRVGSDALTMRGVLDPIAFTIPLPLLIVVTPTAIPKLDSA